MTVTWLCLATLMLPLVKAQIPVELQEVELPEGTLIGGFRASYQGKVFSSFQGVPYAAPPVGDLRFASPRDPLPWSSSQLDVSGQAKVKCIQNSVHDSNDDIERGFDANASEDCLYLNIYRHEGLESTGKPVIVYYHGGNYLWGDNTYQVFGPELFMDHDIILVQVNYRVGPFGFLSLGTADCPGNQALRDQAKALQWVVDHIEYFGGDPNNITIMGQSAGSFSVFYQLFSPFTSGLFQKAVLLTGTLDYFRSFRSMTSEEGIEAGKGLSEAMGCSGDDMSARLDCLRNLDSSIIHAQRYALDQPGDILSEPPAMFIGYTGTIDADYMPEGEAFLPDNPITLMETGNFHSDVSIIAGTTKDEGYVGGELLILVPAVYSIFAAEWEWYGPYLTLGVLSRDEITQEHIDIYSDALDFYIGGLQNYNEQHLSGIIDLLTDAWWLYGTHKFVESAAEKVTGEVFQYHFEYNGQNHWMDLSGINGSAYGVNHADDLFSLFYPFVGYGEELRTPEISDEDEAVALRHVSMLVRFAEADGGSNAMQEEYGWDPVCVDDHRYLKIDSNLTMDASDYYKERMSFWQSHEPYN